MKYVLIVLFLTCVAAAYLFVFEGRKPAATKAQTREPAKQPTKRGFNSKVKLPIDNDKTARLPGKEDEKPDISRIAELIANIGKPEARKELDGFGKKAIPYLLDFLKKSDCWEDKTIALWIIGDIGDPEGETGAAECLLAILKDADLLSLEDKEYEFYSAAVNELGHIGDKTATDYLLSLASDMKQSYSFRVEAISSLAKIADPRSMDTLIELLNDETFFHDMYGYFIPKALGNIGDRKAIPPLLDALRAKNFDPVTVITALGKLEAKQAVPDIAAHMRDAGKRDILHVDVLTSSAAEALGRIGSQDAISELWSVVRDTDESPEKLGPEIDRNAYGDDMEAYQEACRQREFRKVPAFPERFYALRELAKLGDEKATAMLVDLLDTDYDDGRKYKKGAFSREAVGSALEQATGRKYGADYEKWREFLERQRK